MEETRHRNQEILDEYLLWKRLKYMGLIIMPISRSYWQNYRTSIFSRSQRYWMTISHGQKTS